MTENKKTFLINVAYYLVIIAMLLVAVKLLFGVLFPFFLAVCLTVAVQRTARKISKKFDLNISKVTIFAVCGSYLCVAVLLSVILYILFGQLWDIIGQLSSDSSVIDNIFDAASSFLEKLATVLPKELQLNLSSLLQEFVSNAVTTLAEALTHLAAKLISAMPSFLLGFIVTILASFYISKDYETSRRFLLSVMSQKLSTRLAFLKNLFFGYTFKVIRGYFYLLCITFLELLVGLLLLGKKYSVLLAFLIALIDLLPLVGTGTVLVPWAIFELFSGSLFSGIGLLVLFAIVSIARNILEPKIIGKQLGIHPVIMLLAIYCGYRLFGFLGILISPIVTVLIKGYFEYRFNLSENNN